MAAIIGPFLFGIESSSVDWIIVDTSQKGDFIRLPQADFRQR
jgi:hypothetical protein